MGISLLSQFFFICILSNICITNFTHVYSQCLEDQKSVLLELKNDLIFDVSASRKLAQWNQTEDCCSWDGVECDGSGHVISLQLDNELISGGIENSSSLFSLRYLEKLNLAYNCFDNIQIPSGIHNLTYLTHLNLSNAGFGGQIPVELSLMRRLVSLDMSSVFPGIQPLELVNPNLQMLLQNLTGLRELYLDGVNISAQGSEWCQVISSSLPDLRILSLRSCNLSGPLDPSLLQLHSLSVLQLDTNNLSTTVPDFFANFSSLTTLSLSSCSLKGSFPEMIFQVPTLQILDLSHNMLLSGTIPQFPQSGSFRTMVLSNANFSGSLPDSISNLRMLSKIDVSNCKFIGPIPSTLANLTELVYVDLSVNFFTNSIPPFYMSKKLVYIDLSRNILTGSLSSLHFDGHSNLVYINLGYNSLSGSIPQPLFGLPSLQKLLLSNNQLTGPVNEFSALHSSNMDMLDLSSNRLEGPIPESFFKLERIAVLSLSYNFFNGTVRLEKFQRLRSLSTLELSHNNLSVDASSTNSSLSTFPQLSRLSLASCNLYKFPDLIKRSNIAYLDLSNNQITGEIPSWIWETGNGALLHLNLSSNQLVDLQKPYHIPSSLGVLDLHSNQLRGELLLPPQAAVYVDYSNNNFEKPIPLNIGNFTSFLIFFSLANNSLTGEILISLCNATYLQVLDLSVNNLSGGIPPCLVENTENLGVFTLGRNNISGAIPDKFPVNCGLKILDLSNNYLEGNIPQSLANCKSLEVMNVGNNKIDDSFPCMLSSSLRVLVLRSNRFHGEVRCHNIWPNLQIIDIASNNFSGYLYPTSFSSWRGMMLDNDTQLRRNHLCFNFLNLNNFYYQDEVTLIFKGLELKLVKILTVFTSIDFSCNNFQGEIPDAIGDLSSLYVLNLSHNSLTGTIPKSLGYLKQLGSLDLSMNQLTGVIPMELAELTFLSFLNLSYNKLVGLIPEGPQFQTFSVASFEGNTGLCGFPVNISCSHTDENDVSPPTLKSVQSYQKTEIDWDYVSAALGFVVGLGSILWLIWCCQSLRQKFSEQVDQVLVKIFDIQDRKRRHGGRVLRNQVRRQ
ncbi:hypothetical protein Pfo_027212 [Paulownia fortunei]|nr:hypothetical protein Pfo_027212 [Paulownia fortunei]